MSEPPCPSGSPFVAHERKGLAGPHNQRSLSLFLLFFILFIYFFEQGLNHAFVLEVFKSQVSLSLSHSLAISH